MGISLGTKLKLKKVCVKRSWRWWRRKKEMLVCNDDMEKENYENYDNDEK
jgi:hypothetical protein